MSNLQDLGVGAKITVFRLPDGYISATRTVRRVHKHVLVCSMGDKWNRVSGAYEGEYSWSNRDRRVRPSLPGDVDVVDAQNIATGQMQQIKEYFDTDPPPSPEVIAKLWAAFREIA